MIDLDDLVSGIGFRGESIKAIDDSEGAHGEMIRSMEPTNSDFTLFSATGLVNILLKLSLLVSRVSFLQRGSIPNRASRTWLF